MAIETNWEVNMMMAVLCIGNLSVLILDFLDGCVGPWQPWPLDIAEQIFLFFRVYHLHLLYPSLLQNNAIAAAICGEKLQQA